MNNKITEAMRDRNNHLRKAQKSNSTYQWGMYRKLRNFANREIKSSKSNYYCNLIEESKGDSSMVWKAVNEASSRKVSSSGKISAQPHTTLCIQFLDRENKDKNNRLPLGKQICFTIVWGCAEIFTAHPSRSI